MVFNIVKDDNDLDLLNNQIITVKYTHRIDILN